MWAIVREEGEKDRVVEDGRREKENKNEKRKGESKRERGGVEQEGGMRNYNYLWLVHFLCCFLHNVDKILHFRLFVWCACSNLSVTVLVWSLLFWSLAFHSPSCHYSSPLFISFLPFSQKTPFSYSAHMHTGIIFAWLHVNNRTTSFVFAVNVHFACEGWSWGRRRGKREDKKYREQLLSLLLLLALLLPLLSSSVRTSGAVTSSGLYSRRLHKQPQLNKLVHMCT